MGKMGQVWHAKEKTGENTSEDNYLFMLFATVVWAFSRNVFIAYRSNISYKIHFSEDDNTASYPATNSYIKN